MNEPKYQRLSDGKATTADDPMRGIWYGICTYWTDDWTKVASGAIPCCPKCGSPGFQIEAGQWEAGAQQFAATHPGYLVVLSDCKERCHGKKQIMRLYNERKGACVLCHGCLPPGEQCAACDRINATDIEC